MPSNIADIRNLIGKEVRRVTFSLLQGGEYYLVFSVIEELQPDMQDFHAYGKFTYALAKKSRNDGSHDKIFFSVDRFTVTEEFLYSPIDNFQLESKNHETIHGLSKEMIQSPSDLDNRWIGSDGDGGDLFKCFPLRQEMRYLNAWIDPKRKAERIIMRDHCFKSQLSQLSVDCYGVDLTRYPEFLGNIYLIRYNPYFQSIDWSVSDSPAGIYATINHIRLYNPLEVQFINRGKNGLMEYSVTYMLDLLQRNHFFSLPDVPQLLDIIIRDRDGNAVYSDRDVTFIRRFVVDMQIKTSNLRLGKRDGSEMIVDKFSSETFSVGNDSNQDSPDMALNSAEEAYRVLEKNLDFILFGGSADMGKKEEDVTKARSAIRRILESAKKEVMIADPYVNLEVIENFVFPISHSYVPVRILGCKEYLAEKHDSKRNETSRAAEAKAISGALGNYNAAYPKGKVMMRLLNGKGDLHDRYIVADDVVWLIGTSLNEIGIRASSIIKLPRDSRKAVIHMLESWWSDSDKTISVDDYGNSNKS